MKTPCITLRFFSGIHLGAEISLSAGTYSLGKDASCDIILHDQSIAAKHIQLRISLLHRSHTDNDEEAKIEVRVENLDACVSDKDKILENGALLQPRQAYMLGQVCFAYFSYGEAEQSLGLEESLQGQLLHNSPTKANAEPQNKELEGKKLGSENFVGTSANDIGEQDESLSAKEERKAKKWKSLMLFVCIALLVLGITISMKSKEQILHNNKTLLEETLEKEGFQSLVVDHDTETVSVYGLLQNDEEFSRLAILVQGMHFPVYLNIEIESDLKDALTKSLHSRSLYPIVHIDAQNKKLDMRLYLKDQLIFAALKAQVIELFPALQSYTINYVVFFADSIETMINDSFKAPLREKFRLEFLPGVIKILGNLSSAELTELKQSINAIAKKLDIFLVTDFIRQSIAEKENTRTKKPQEKEEKKAKTLDKPQETLLFVQSQLDNAQDLRESNTVEFKVTSVNLSPLKYIILSNGKRVFTGGQLPGGFTLIDVALDELTLEKDQAITKHYLQNVTN